MRIDAHSAVIDNDFINHLVESKLLDDRLVEVLNIVFSKLALFGVMHPLVFEHELLFDKRRIKLLFDEKVVQKAEFSDIFLDDSGKEAYYIFLVTELYRRLTGKEFPVEKAQVLNYWKRQQSLGEVHSIAMCLVCECGIFLSDDADSKILKGHVERLSLGKVEVYSRYEFMELFASVGETTVTRNERRSLAHSSSQWR